MAAAVGWPQASSSAGPGNGVSLNITRHASLLQYSALLLLHRSLKELLEVSEMVLCVHCSVCMEAV